MNTTIAHQQSNAPRSHWSSRWTFILVTAGSAVGIGNIWRFPYLTGTHGGGVFVLMYLACLLVVGLSLMMAEIMLGRRGHANSVTSIANIARESNAHPLWRHIGWLSILSTFCILCFYPVVAGWVMEYTLRAAIGFTHLPQQNNSFTELLTHPLTLIFWHTLFVLLTGGVVLLGVIKGIERANYFMMPALFFILVGMFIYAALNADLARAFTFMFKFELSQLTSSVLLAALGQAFITLGLGNGIMIVYGSYLKSETPIPRTSLYVVAADTLIAIMAGLVIFAIVFAQRLKTDFGAGLLFETLPHAFSTMPGGHLWGFAFFVLLIFAALTSAISLLEPLVAVLIERFQFKRARAVILISAATWLVGIAVCLSFNTWSNAVLFDVSIFDMLDGFSSKILMPLSGLLIALFCGWVVRRDIIQSELGLNALSRFAWEWSMKLIAPISILFIFINNI